MDGTSLPAYLIAAAIGYVSGSIPFGLLLTRMAGLGDIRSIGSGNIGATNVLRTGKRWLAGATLLCDVLKGLVPVAVIFQVFAGGSAAASGDAAGFAPAHAAAVAAFLGHTFPAWLGFKGGKGVATYIGVALGLAWPLALVFCGTWLVIAALFRYSSLSALAAAVVVPLAAIGLGYTMTGAVLAALSAVLVVKHHGNIQRLLSGAEPRIGAKG